VTGEINGVIYEAYLIERGSISKPLRPLALSGNIYEALKSLSMGRDVTQTGLRIISPSIALEGLTVA
jgi:predicted Zn-dependent protease